MKSFIFIGSVFAVSVLIILGGAWLLTDRSAPQELGDARDLDILNNANLIREINSLRGEAGMNLLRSDENLSHIAQETAEKANTNKIAGFVTNNEFMISYSVLSGEEPRQFYSARGFVNWLSQDADMNGVLRAEGSKIGVWVAYIVEDSTAKPVPWVSVIVI